MNAAEACQFDPDRLARLPAAILADVEAARIDGAEVLVARGGRIVLHQAIGYAHRESERRMDIGDVFMSMSVSKQFTNMAVLQCVERGDLAIDTPVAAVIPEFAEHGKSGITIGHLITHTSGLPPVIVGDKSLNAADIGSVTAALSRATPLCPPGERFMYSPVLAHGLLAEIVRRLDRHDRRFARILADDVFEPLGMTDTVLGIPAEVRPRYVPVVVRDRTPGLFPPGVLESSDRLKPDSEMPGGGCVTTASDVFRFAECWRQKGRGPGGSLLAPALVRFALEDRTGKLPNSLYAHAVERGWGDVPSHMSYGFWLRGTGVHPAPFGHLASPGTFGGLGAGSHAFWVDPVSDVTFVLLSAGLLEDSASIERFRRLSDLVHCALEG
ncbi:beta-lactamase family protein [Zavarzinia compransoris]|uniref:serine hydrolase domain-containing protein n=1 Tax=Zavarzinia marina TaxID=2911065 RepID=UPI001F1CDD31|nr:serine hydrolase domain-containing protein [Zavarzinia marina]MCF4166458.1 beta-lactamase family protein [Zavarzinia marina]